MMINSSPSLASEFVDDSFRNSSAATGSKNIVSQLQTPNIDTSNPSKSIAETKQLIQNFQKNMKTYPKCLSHECSVVLCTLISLDQNKDINLDGLPDKDKKLILDALPLNSINKIKLGHSKLAVNFDVDKDFIISYSNIEDTSVERIELRFFNTVFHKQMENKTGEEVQVQPDKIAIGKNIILNTKEIKRLSGLEQVPIKHEVEADSIIRKQQVSGRNAYEIRADILNMAIAWLSRPGQSNITVSSDDVVELAKKFYSFVENKR